MSTFDGIVHEFPHIRIDFFRFSATDPPPLACFLSHVHSDHLQGLETLRSPFVYCSTVTRRLLLRVEKYPHRINYAKGILESRKQDYRHLHRVLKPLPLQTPTELELAPKQSIRVTLFDANHCPGAVMFLIEGGGQAILYTGDVRAEAWWINSIVREPVLIPYSLGRRRLDCIYLDTTFAAKDDVYQEFQPKAEGLRELLDKVTQYPPGKIFYFRAWTFGYEDIWIALSAALGSKIHVDDYQLYLYRTLTEEKAHIHPGPALVGFYAGNHYHHGCLTSDRGAQIHSCDPGSKCYADLKQQDIVWITPIVSRTSTGVELLELGAGGGRGDLHRIPELDIRDPKEMEALKRICAPITTEGSSVSWLVDVLSAAKPSNAQSILLDALGMDPDEPPSLQEFVELLARNRKSEKILERPVVEKMSRLKESSADDKTICFPCARHSSYSELQHFVQAFRPRDICPCTVDTDRWSESVSMQTLFGDLCSGATFAHDRRVRARVKAWKDEMDVLAKRKRQDEESETDSGLESQGSCPSVHIRRKETEDPSSQLSLASSAFASQPEHFERLRHPDEIPKFQTKSIDPQDHDGRRRIERRIEAYRAARKCLHTSDGRVAWEDLGITSLEQLEDEVEL